MSKEHSLMGYVVKVRTVNKNLRYVGILEKVTSKIIILKDAIEVDEEDGTELIYMDITLEKKNTISILPENKSYWEEGDCDFKRWKGKYRACVEVEERTYDK